MKKITDIDENFKIESKLNLPDIQFYNIENQPFSIHGLIRENGLYRRMPGAVAATVNNGVYVQSTNTAGGRVRFCTDSPYIAIHAEMPPFYLMSHFAMTGSSCFDLYVRKPDGSHRFVGAYVRQPEDKAGYDGILRPQGSGMREYTIDFPTYADVSALYIGLSETAEVRPAPKYTIENPVVFYGSSITQGACATRPGSTYDSILSRQFDFDYINLGFSGSAQGEQEMAAYIAGLPMSCFVMDYDYNAPSPEHLAHTHEPFYRTIRQAHPELPILMLSRPVYYQDENAVQRLNVIRKTYENAKAAGDQNAYLIESSALMALAEDGGLVDNVHPNDLGFASMAKAVAEVMKEIW